jgi:hypothetical protein
MKPISPASTTRYHTARFWTWEILAILLAVGLMLAKVGILVHFEGQELPDWPLSINLSTLIALLSIIQRAALLLVLAEIVGQAKWMWFTERDRPVYHLEEFNDASRSTLGAIQLFFLGITNQAQAGIKSLVLLAALITVLSFTIGPFTQQAFNQTPCRRLVSSITASVPVAHYVSGFGPENYDPEVIRWKSIDSAMRGVMLNGLMNPDAQDTTVQAQCSTGDCTFPDYGTGVTYSSIAMCSRCLDSTSIVPYPDKDLNLSLSDGASLDFNSGNNVLAIQSSNLSYAESLFTDEFAEDAPYSVLNVSMLAVSSKGPLRYRLKRVVAASCIIYPCLESYRGSVRGGSLEETVVSREHVLPKSESPSWWIADHDVAFQSPCVLDNGTWYTAENITSAAQIPGREFVNITLNSRNTTAPQECLYEMVDSYSNALGKAMREVLLGNCTLPMAQDPLDCGSSWWLEPLHNNGTATAATFTSHIESLTRAVTNHLRKTGVGVLASPPEGPRAAMAYGETYERTTCTTVDWRWLLPPIIFVAATALLLSWVILRGRLQDTAQPVWKGSIMPLLFYGFQGARMEQEGLASSSRLADWSELKQVSKSNSVRFENGSRGLDPGFHYSE